MEKAPTIKGRGKLAEQITEKHRSSALSALLHRVEPNAFCLHPSLNSSKSAFFGQGPPSRYPLDHGVHGLAHEHDALLELNKSNRGTPWTAISRFNRRSRVLMVGRPAAPSLDSSTRLSLALPRRRAGRLAWCRERAIAREPRRAGAPPRCRWTEDPEGGGPARSKLRSSV